MTLEHAFDLLAPLTVPPLILGFVAWLGARVSGLTQRASAWLDARGHAAASAVVADASVRIQAGMANAAGQIALEAEQGHYKLADIMAVERRSIELADGLVKKLPDTIRALNPAPGSIAEGIRGKITAALPSPAPIPAVAPAAAAPVDALPQDGTFQARASIVVGRLMRDLALTREQACGIVGNLGQESGLRAIQEIRPASGRGGFGWCQWTGPRRLAFEAWAKAQGMSVTDDEANYGFLLEELRTTESAALIALRATTTLEEATRVFEEKFERAGVAALARRQTFAQQAMAA